MMKLAVIAVFIMFLFTVTAAVQANAQGCTPGEAKPCGSNMGACQEGERACQDGEWSDCVGETGPQQEICGNEIDDDCNGLVDECLVSIWPILVIIGFSMLLVMGLLMKMGFG